MHDFFDILGVSHDARAAEIRRACQGRVPSAHPDIAGTRRRIADQPADLAGARSAGLIPTEDLSDASVDFVNMTSIVERMRAAFFSD